MEDRMISSWRRKSDPALLRDDGRVQEKDASSLRTNADNLEAWEDEGGRTGRVSSEIPHILIVDTDMGSADALELMLNAAGYVETRVAYSGHAALAVAAEFRPAIAFIEMNLLDMDASELAQRLREHAQVQDLRLIAVTSSRQHASRDVARNAGFERYLLKPIGVAELSDLLAANPGRAAIS